MKNVSLFLSAGIVLLFASSVQAQIPRLISYQGVLSDSLNNPRPDAAYSFTFRLYDASTGGTALWSEAKSLQTRRGLFSTLLGDQVALGAVPFDRQYWLGIQVGSDPELLPRISLSAVGYSFSSVRSDTARYALVAPQQAIVDSARIAGTIPDNSITTSKIANGTIQSADVAASFKAPLADTANFARAAVPGGIAGGHLSGTYPNPTIANNAITPDKINTSGAINGQSLTYNGANVVWGNPAGTLTLPFSGSGSTGSGAVLSVTNTATSGDVFGIRGESTSPGLNSHGVFGLASDTSAIFSSGVTGLSASTSGRGLYGWAVAAHGANAGVWGESLSPDGKGVFGWARASTGMNVGVFGQTESPAGYAGYFQGRVRVEGTLSAASLSAPAGGDLSGSYPNPTIADNTVTSSKIVNGTIQFADIAQNAAASGQVMKWNGTSWIAGNDSVGTGPWQANGTTAYYNDGNVGIGISSPAHRLSVLDSLNGLRVATNTAGGSLASFGGFGTFKIDAPGLAGGRLQVLENGNVGIGKYNSFTVLDPVRPLDVHGAIGVYDHGTRTFLGGIASEALTEMIDFGMNDDGTGRFGGYTPASQGGLFRVDTRGGYNVFQFLARQAGSTNLISDVMDITSDGKVGIGTTTPQGALDVSSTTGAFLVPRMTTTQRDALTAVNGMIIYNTTTNQFNFRENGAWVTK